MKNYSIGLTLLFALMNTGCEDAKAESKDYDVEIAELQQQITQLSSRLDSTIKVIPKKYNYEGVTDSQGNLTINIPGLQLEDLPVISFAGNDSEGFKLNIPMYMNIKNDMIYFNNVDIGQEIKIQIIK